MQDYRVNGQPSRSTQPGHPFVGRHNEYHPKAGSFIYSVIFGDIIMSFLVSKQSRLVAIMFSLERKSVIVDANNFLKLAIRSF